MDTETEIRFDRELDARGLNCPLPILRTKKSLNDMTHGQVLKVVATDPGSVRDFQAFCKQTGNQLLLPMKTAGNIFSCCARNDSAMPDIDRLILGFRPRAAHAVRPGHFGAARTWRRSAGAAPGGA